MTSLLNQNIINQILTLDLAKLGLQTFVLVFIQAGNHSSKVLGRFAADIVAMEEVLDFYHIAGEVDYFLRVVVPDAAAFDAFYRRLIDLIPLKNVTSLFVLESVKSETALPIAN